MSAPLPKRLHIGHLTLDVQFNEAECEAQDANGFIVADQRRIVLRPKTHPDKQREVMLHEVLHAAVSAGNLILASDEDEERVVAGLTGPLLDALRRNPRLVAYLTSQE